MDIEDGSSLITKAFEKREEEKAFDLYKARYQWMDESTFMPFNQFYQPKKMPEKAKSEGEILSEVKEILDMAKGGWTS